MRVSGLARRGRHFGIASCWSCLLHPFQVITAPNKHKHIKIDDEEQLFATSQLCSPPPAGSALAPMLKMALLTLLVLLVILTLLAYIIYKPPKLLFDFMTWKNPDVLWQLPLPASQRIVALTLDDAPSAYTSTMLDLLKEYNATATFFIIGDQVAPYSSLLQRMSDEGHEVGNHAWTDEKSVLRPLSELERQIKDVQALLPENKNGQRYFRPGGGFFNKKMVERVKSLGYRLVLGCIYPHDPQLTNAEVNARHVLSMVRPGGIIIMHDRRGHSAPQLELVLKGLKKEGWEVVSLGELLAASEKVNGK
jgi:peptidoglycan/xylan/chitin deacetylase (PgdA/CDA1 family)